MLRTFLACFILATFTASGQAANQISIRLMGALVPGSAIEQTTREFAQSANRRLSDLARVEIVRESSLQSLKNVTSGDTDLAVVPSTLVLQTTKDNNFAVFDLPFLFTDLEEVQALQESPLGVELLTSVTTQQVLALGFWNGGMTKIFGQPVTNFTQLSGLRLTSTTSSAARPSTDKLGVVVRQLPASDVAPAFQAHSIDAAELPPHFVSKNVVQLNRTSISPTNYRPFVYVLIANKSFWKKLPFQAQSIIGEEVRASARYATKTAVQLDGDAVASLRQREFTYVSIDRAGQDGIKEVAKASWSSVLPLGPGSFLSAALEFLLGSRSISSPPPPIRTPTNVPIMFGTDRADERVVDPRFRFGGKRGPLLFGELLVGVGSNNPIGNRPAMQLGPVELYDKQEFQGRLTARLDRAAEKQILLYIHGYNNSFVDAVETAALLAVDLKFQGNVVIFSWPSGGAVLDYLGDEDEVLTSRMNFVEFLSGINTLPRVDRLHVLTHSMGGRLVTEAMDWMNGRQNYGSKLAYNLVLAAPDIYSARFKLALGSMQALSSRVSLYASDNDEALVCSDRIAHGNRRAGQAGQGIIVEAQLDTLDATPADPRTWKNFPCTPVGHSYIVHNATVLADLQSLVVADIPPARRFRLLQRNKDGHVYWEFQPTP
jgi:TRAP-type C4-dicarboxylate transport system substrate-binding protein